ncbi:MAG: hypothetical protein ABJ263_00565 [Tateyamaria sp.]|uniref:hypothetical protein n=1 Tax=Tateyamaria sp. TaxID=1929288 RepID=UPI0032812FA0
MRRLFPTDPAKLFGPKGFNLKLAKPQKLTVAGTVRRLQASDDPMTAWLYANGHVLTGAQPTTAGWLPIRCPWAHTHSGGAITGTDYLAAVPRGFHCFHGHCQHRRPVDFIHHYATQGAPLAHDMDSTGTAPAQLTFRVEEGDIASEVWGNRDSTQGALTLAEAMGQTFMRGPDIRDILVGHSAITAPHIASAVAAHVRQLRISSIEEHERAMREGHKMGLRINATPELPRQITSEVAD